VHNFKKESIMTLANSCRFIGRLGQEPDLQYTPGGTSILKIGLAVNGRRKVDDEWEDETTWVNLTVFGPAAENMAQYSSKGDMLVVEAQYQKRKYTDSDGDERTGHDFIVREWQVVSRVSRDGASEDVVATEEDEETLPF
jgi:single-strand DNA-binding protein